MMFDLDIIPPLTGIISIIIAGLIYLYIKRQPGGLPLMQELEGMIHQGTMAFLKRGYLFLSFYTLFVTLVLWFFFRDWHVPCAFISGILSSVVAIHMGVKGAARGNSRTAEAADKYGQARALTTAYFSGSITGLSVAALGLVGIGIWFWMFGECQDIVRYLSGFALGASSVAIFIRVGGGIFTKAADLGSVMAARIEPGISQDDFRNPGVIADNAGDNVGDIAGMGADLFESYVAAILSSIVIGAFMTITPGSADQSPVLHGGGQVPFTSLYITLPLLIMVAGQIGSFFGIISIKALRVKKTATALRATVIIADCIFSILSALIIWLMDAPWGVFWALFSGIICGIAMGIFAEYSASGPQALHISEQARSGPAAVVISGLAAGMRSTSLPVLVICVVIFTGHYTAGIYGLGIAAVGMLATAGVAMTVDACGSIAGNAGGISRMSGQDFSTRRIAGLDLMGNTTASIGKGFA
ncbi:MAG: sodium/proton-translocating pyrophosphatase, partial [Deltaproteobacteria bacterium]|nr:sodium/proton-translocating pyrophosphatase [Deltaproteobacteria bacterium]